LKDWHRFGPCARAEGRKLKKTAHAESMIGKLLSSVDDVTQTVDTIATLSMEQATNIQQVNRAVRQMDQVTQQCRPGGRSRCGGRYDADARAFAGGECGILQAG
jgi:hypothetical protein